jgi:hypothetical protein
MREGYAANVYTAADELLTVMSSHPVMDGIPRLSTGDAECV